MATGQNLCHWGYFSHTPTQKKNFKIKWVRSKCPLLSQNWIRKTPDVETGVLPLHERNPILNMTDQLRDQLRSATLLFDALMAQGQNTRFAKTLLLSKSIISSSMLMSKIVPTTRWYFCSARIKMKFCASIKRRKREQGPGSKTHSFDSKHTVCYRHSPVPCDWHTAAHIQTWLHSLMYVFVCICVRFQVYWVIILSQLWFF